MKIAIYQMPSLFTKLKQLPLNKHIQLYYTNCANEVEYDYIFIPNNENLLELVSSKRAIIVFEAFSEEMITYWQQFYVKDCVTVACDWEMYLYQLYLEMEKYEKNKYKIYLKNKFSVRAMKESLAYDLLHGRAQDVREIWERKNLAQLNHLPNVVLLLNIDNFQQITFNRGDYWKNEIRNEVLQVIREELPFHNSLIVLSKENQYAILLPVDEQYELNNIKERLIQQAAKIQEEIRKKTSYKVTIGIGNHYEDVRNIHRSYKESEQAQSYRIFTENSSIIHIQDIEQNNTSYDELKEQIKNITTNFVYRSIKEIEKNCANLFDYIVKNKIEPFLFRLQMIEMIGTLTEVAIQNGANPTKIMPLQMKFAKEIYDLETMKQYEYFMIDVIKQYIALIQASHNESSLRSIQEIINYVEKNYHKDISLEELANIVRLSPNYISHLFKQTTGHSFVDYVTAYRIKIAKQLLENLHLTIYDIAEQVGFSSSQYFSRVFKKIEGYTPTQYRNNLIGIL